MRALVLGLGLGLGLSAALSADEAQPLPTPTPSATPGPSGWVLSSAGREPLVLPDLGLPGHSLAPVREAALFAGLRTAWRSSARVLELSAPSGRKLKLILGDAALYDGGQRVLLSSPLELSAGAPCLDPLVLQQALARLVTATPSWAPADAATLAAAQARWYPVLPALVLKPRLTPSPSPTFEPAHVSAKPLNGEKLRSIVIDAGHGGHDPGAHGPRGLKEKEVCLDIALRLGAELAQRAPDLKIIYTRDSDRYLTLRERTEIANRADADLFVSIHNNASPNRSSHGTQVFFYDSQTSDRAAMDLVSRENEQANELEILMTDLAKSLVRDQSIRMASNVQQRLFPALLLKHRDLSYAPFYVLARTKMPAVLVEVAFLTNPDEERKLADPDFRQTVAENLAVGLLDYRRFVEGKH